MPVPKPKPDENKDDFLKRCISFLVDEGTDNEQAVAICYNQWRERDKMSKTIHKDDYLEIKAGTIIVKEMPIEIKETDDKNRIIHAVISKEEVDRDGDIVVVKGINAKHWKKNPVIMADHGHTIDKVIGKGVGRKYWIEGDEAHIKYQLAGEYENPLAEMAYRLYKGGYLKTMSISFMPNFDKIEYPEKHPKGARRVFPESEMIEGSITPLPSNRAAYMKSIEKAWDDGVLDGEELNTMKELDKGEEFEHKVVDVITAPEIIEKTKALAKELSDKDNKIAELELQLKEQENEEEIDEFESYLAELFGEFNQANSSEEEADVEQTDEEFAEEVLTILEENDKDD